ncbi:hypothetical protein FBY05_10778 [Pseudomonas sp. SJZ083]|nr:hypothetical protein FBY05_10778 [Pseudomonas sp. SJZ083]TWC48728.1 hypothetical protein FBY01_107186 [Pseudomonas sp. SJZ077]
MWRCGVLHFSKRAIDVTAVKLMISANVNHRAMECVVRPSYAARFDINVTGQDDHIRIAWCWIEPSELQVQI